MKNVCNRKKQLLILCSRSCIALFLALFTYSLKATTDTLKNKQLVYDINDPRNPNCPCHKYQKLADEEFLNQQKPKDEFVVQLADIQSYNMHLHSYMPRKNVILEEFQPQLIEINSNSIIQYNKNGTRYKKTKKNEGKIQRKLVITKLKFKIFKIYNYRRKVKFSKNYNSCFTWH